MNLIQLDCASLFQGWVVGKRTTDTPKRTYLLEHDAELLGHTRITKQVLYTVGPVHANFFYEVCVFLAGTAGKCLQIWGEGRVVRMRYAGPCTGSDESSLGGYFMSKRVQGGISGVIMAQTSLEDAGSLGRLLHLAGLVA